LSSAFGGVDNNDGLTENDGGDGGENDGGDGREDNNSSTVALSPPPAMQQVHAGGLTENNGGDGRENDGGDSREDNNNSSTVALSPPPAMQQVHAGNARPAVPLVSAPGAGQNARNNRG
jgi:hypothetical protein